MGDDGADATVFSFYANKTITTGEGGMLVSKDQDLLARARKMRLHGIDRDVFNRFTSIAASWKYDVVAPGFKYNLTDIASAIGIVQLHKAQNLFEQRQDLAARYDTALAGLPLVLAPQAAPGDTHSHHLYVVQVAASAKVGRDHVIKHLNDAGIGTSVHYRPLHQMTYWKPFSGNLNFPHADAYFDRCLSIPLFAGMSDAQQSYVVETLKSAFA